MESSLNNGETKPVSGEVKPLETPDLKKNLETGAANLAEAKNKGGRPKGTKDSAPRKNAKNPTFGPAPIAPVDMTQSMMGLAQMGSVMAIAGTGWDGWKLSPEEVGVIGTALEECRKLYFPDGNAKHLPALVLAGALMQVIVSRQADYRAFKAEEAKKLKKPVVKVEEKKTDGRSLPAN